MKRYFPIILILAVMVGLFMPGINVKAAGPLGTCTYTSTSGNPPQTFTYTVTEDKDACAARTPPGTWSSTVPPQQQKDAANKQYDNNEGFWMKNVVRPGMETIANTVLTIVGLLTGIAGMVLNGVILYTVVNISENYEKLPAISEAWRVIRDIANMGFIFVLLYASIMTIIGKGEDNQKLIMRIVMVAILVNFSLFFTKIVIDISNLLSLLFYDAMVPGAAEAGFDRGLSNAFMNHLKLQGLFDVKEGVQLDFFAIIITAVMGSIMLLIAAFVFFAISLLLIIRYVVLILVLILSPIAFVSFVLPGLKGKFDEWWKALSAQAFFAPVYFMLTWVTLTILGGLTKAFGGQGGSLANVGLASQGVSKDINNITQFQGFFPTFINFVVVIVFLIASLLISKKWADGAGGGINKLTGWATGAAGGATIGMAGRFGRRTVGSWGGNAANDEDLKARARRGDIGARLKLATANKMSKSSFDIRATGMGAKLDAGKGQKGGWAQDQKDAAKKFEAYKPSGDSIKEAKKVEESHEKGIQQAAETAERKSADHTNAENRLKEERKKSTRGFTDEQFKARAEKLKVIQDEIENHKEERAERVKTYSTTAPELIEARAAYSESKKNRENLENTMEDMAKSSERRAPSVRIINWAVPGSGYVVGGKDRAAAIRAAAKGKSTKDKAADLLKDMAKEDGVETEEEKTPPTPTTPPGTPAP